MPLLGKDADIAARYGLERDLRDRPASMARIGRRRLAHRHVPLLGEHRLDDLAGAAAARHHHPVRLLADEQAGGTQIGQHALARDEPVEPAIGSGAFSLIVAVSVKIGDRLELVALADREVVEIVRGRDLHAAGAELADRRTRRR